VTTPTRPTRTASPIRAARTIHIPSQPNALPTARPGLHPPSLQPSTPPLPRNAPVSAALVSAANLPGSSWPARRSERRAARPSGVGPCPPAAARRDRTASCRPRPGVGSALPASSVTRRGADVGSAGCSGSDQRRGESCLPASGRRPAGGSARTGLRVRTEPGWGWSLNFGPLPRRGRWVGTTWWNSGNEAAGGDDPLGRLAPTADSGREGR